MHSRGSYGTKGRWAVGVCAAMVAVTAAACAGETECVYADEVPTGNVHEDITRCWQGIGEVIINQDPGYLVVYDFRPSPGEGQTGFFREVQSPNRLYPSGTVFEYGFVEVTPDGGTAPILDMGPDLPRMTPEITETSLIVNWLIPTEEGLAVLKQPMRRARACTGFGFDTPEQKCQPIR